MAIAIDVTYNGDSDSPGVDFSITGLGPYSTVTLERIDNTGTYSTEAVRGFDGVAASASMAGSDYEAPIGKSLKYRVTGSNPGTEIVDSANITLPYTNYGDAWLKSVSQPALSLKVTINDWSHDELPTRILGEYKVLGRKRPVILTDVWGARTTTIKIITDDNRLPATFEGIRNLITEGRTLLLQTVTDFSHEKDLYFEVDAYDYQRQGIIQADGKNVYHHTISLLETDRPATSEESLGLRSYQNVIDQNTTYQAVLDNYLLIGDSYLTLLNRAP